MMSAGGIFYQTPESCSTTLSAGAEACTHPLILSYTVEGEGSLPSESAAEGAGLHATEAVQPPEAPSRRSAFDTTVEASVIGGLWRSCFLSSPSVILPPLCLLFPYERYKSLGCDHGDTLGVLQRQEVFVAGNNIRSLGALRRGNDHIVIRITDHYGHLGYITHEAGKDTQSLNKIAGCLIRIMVAMTMASLLIKKHPLGFVKYLFREVQEKSSFTGMAKERV